MSASGVDVVLVEGSRTRSDIQHWCYSTGDNMYLKRNVIKTNFKTIEGVKISPSEEMIAVHGVLVSHIKNNKPQRQIEIFTLGKR